MPGFKAAEAVDALDFDLSPYGPKGTIPEPSREQVDEWFERNLGIDREMGLDADALREEIAEAEDPGDVAMIYGRALARISESERREAARKRIPVMAALCGDALTEEDIRSLPFRHQEAFFGWLTGMFRNPTSSPNGSGPSTSASDTSG